MNLITKAKRHAARLALTPIFNTACSFSHEDRIDVSSKSGFEPIVFHSGDGCELQGYIYRAPGQSNDQGTCFHRHGFTENCTKSWNLESVKRLSKKFNITVVSFDSRHHGWSSHSPYFPTFGAAEAFDIQAAMDLADKRGLPKPYILHGVSLGAMASQRAGIIDTRVKGLFLVSPPAWPWDAVGVTLKRGVMAGLWIDHYYTWDILASGDIRTHKQSKEHQPLVCYVMGDHDHYNIEHTKEVFRHWHQGGDEGWNVLPNDHQRYRKFFKIIEGEGHPGEGNDLRDRGDFKAYEDSFFYRVLSEH